jgi:hypothetical protein
MPHSLNLRKGAKIGQRQIDLARKLHAAGLLSAMDSERVVARQTAGYSEEQQDNHKRAFFPCPLQRTRKC